MNGSNSILDSLLALFGASQTRQPIDLFTTPLSLEEEERYKKWKSIYAPKDSGMDYDLPGAFLAGLTPNSLTGHWPDTYKKPNHPTFSNESIYSLLMPRMAGMWQGETFLPPKVR